MSRSSLGLARTQVPASDSFADGMGKTTEYAEYTEENCLFSV
jgi:hypothetical protein